MRFVLYVLFLILFIVKQVFTTQNFGAAEHVNQLYVLAYVALCIEFIVRLIESRYWPLPAFLAMAMIMGYFKLLPSIEEYVLPIVEIILYVFIGFFLLDKGKRMRIKGRVNSGVTVSVVGIICLLFSVKILAIVFPDQLYMVKWIFRSFIFNLVLILAASGMFFNKSIWRRNKPERDLFLFFIIINMLRVVEIFA